MTNGDGISLSSFLEASAEVQTRMMFEMQLKTHKEVLALKKQFAEQPDICKAANDKAYLNRREFKLFLVFFGIILSLCTGAKIW